jgi:hypothetical protein
VKFARNRLAPRKARRAAPARENFGGALGGHGQNPPRDPPLSRSTRDRRNYHTNTPPVKKSTIFVNT